MTKQSDSTTVEHSDNQANEDTAKTEDTSATEKRKTPLEMVRERQANMQAARRGVGKKGAKGGEAGANATGADGVSKPVQIKRQMGG